MDASPKNVREHIARSKFYLQRKDVLRSLRALSQALNMLAGSQIFGRERIEISILMEEAVRLLCEHDVVKRALPGGLSYKKGQERELAAGLTRMADALEALLGKAQLEERRKRLVELDELVLGGQAELDNKQPLEARKFFRRAMDSFGDEPGLLVDLGNRLMLAGLALEATEYFQKSIEIAPTDPRAYTLLAQCLEALGEGAKAEEVIKASLRRFGPDEGLLVRLAQSALKRKSWKEALASAQAALELNPTGRDARRCAEAASERLFGTAQGYLSGEAPPPRRPIEL
ncbi:Tetratricopeptide repeat-containing protein [Humidesulfovibrio mexicanus]|uniref:Tetratricopeptide repeat-containing protein n=1 Tax=Humidesulfovibrio mexicanus TaxID=147047 RepID=A0A239B4C8_9BACT|nr:tetratricopeptide repeat protein [Humidesulfovibrio mexicanus]SNS02382.1 Tetratricopeptide repeat-containing protein [Humidesulfovibrio mexicanus]